MGEDFDGRTPNGTHPDDGDRSWEDCMGEPPTAETKGGAS
jgi:hypothetical protein